MTFYRLNFKYSNAAGSDYMGISTTLTFLPGDVEIVLPIATLEDAVIEQQEEFSVTLNVMSENAAVDEGDTATVTILSN